MLGSLWFNSFSSGAGASADYELISTTVLGSNTATITFNTSALSAYKHLQLRFTARSTIGGNADNMAIRFNSDSGANYSYHLLLGADTSTPTSSGGASQTFTYVPSQIVASAAASNIFSAGILDLLDFGSTTKNKTIRAFSGFHKGDYQRVGLSSGAWFSTAAITQIDLTNSGSYVTGSRFSLYGLKA